MAHLECERWEDREGYTGPGEWGCRSREHGVMKHGVVTPTVLTEQTPHVDLQLFTTH